jgi:hypothetical protein
VLWRGPRGSKMDTASHRYLPTGWNPDAGQAGLEVTGQAQRARACGQARIT